VQQALQSFVVGHHHHSVTRHPDIKLQSIAALADS
jgi:hypothetical protein